MDGNRSHSTYNTYTRIAILDILQRLIVMGDPEDSMIHAHPVDLAGALARELARDGWRLTRLDEGGDF